MQLHHLAIQTDHRKDEQRKFLAKLRYEAKKRGLRMLKDWSGTWSLVDTKVEPQRALQGLLHVDLLEITIAVSTPLPQPRPRRRKVYNTMSTLIERLNEAAKVEIGGVV